MWLHQTGSRAVYFFNSRSAASEAFFSFSSFASRFALAASSLPAVSDLRSAAAFVDFVLFILELGERVTGSAAPPGQS